MFPAVALSLALAPGVGDPVGPTKYPPVYVPADAPTGYLYRPSYDVQLAPRGPAREYRPKPGDVLLMSDTTPFWTALYRLALTGRPGHGGIVVTAADGRLGVLEAGFHDTTWTRLTPLEYRLAQYPGSIWVRERLVPLTPDQDARLTAFALAAKDGRYATGRFALQLTPFGARGPLRTAFARGPREPGNRLFCTEAITEGAAYAGLLDARTVRPGATYPQDLFYDRSRNPYIDRHPPLRDGWAPPAQWTPVAGWSIKGKYVPKPPSPWPGGPADVVYPLYGEPNEPPTPVVVGHVAGELRPVALVQERPERLGLFDRPPLFPRRRR
jgi:hypothetical protein